MWKRLIEKKQNPLSKKSGLHTLLTENPGKHRIASLKLQMLKPPPTLVHIRQNSSNQMMQPDPAINPRKNATVKCHQYPDCTK